MKIQTDDITFNIISESKSGNNLIPIVLLHGFGGNAEDWNFTSGKLGHRFYTIAVDLIGHGETSSPENPEYYSTDRIVSQLNQLFDKMDLTKFILLGYSMGGRAALSYAVKYPRKITGLILESTSFGISDPEERQQRLNSDIQLAKKIEKEGLETFFNDWYKQTLFDSLTKSHKINLDQIIQKKLKCSSTGLKNILVEFSPAKMPHYLENLFEHNFPVLLINGELDDKYNQINEKAVKLLKQGEHKIVQGAGHNTHLEKPTDFINFVNSFLNKICQY